MPTSHEPAFLEPGAAVDFEEASVAVLPVPFEASVSWRGGTAGGPRAILEASEQLELYDEESRREPHLCGVWTDRMLELPASDGEAASLGVRARMGELLDAGKRVVMLGGEHSITAGAVAAAAERHAGLVVIQLDAHADLRESYGNDRFSHACTAARCLEHAPVRAVGVRSYSAGEAERVRAGIPGYAIVHAWEMEGDAWIARVLDGLDGRPVYLSVDVDYFDPSVMPATGTPEPGGPGWRPTLRFLERLFETTRAIAFDVVELAPAAGLHHADYTAARLTYKLIGMWDRS